MVLNSCKSFFFDMAKNKYHLHLKGFVGGDDFNCDYVDYILDKYSSTQVNVLIDSLGGSLASALSIASAFARHGNVHVHFTGMNASAATIASLGAAHISIDKCAMYLAHKCSTEFFEWGSLNADQFRTLVSDCTKLADNLDKMDANIASMYADKCKKNTQQLLDLMKVGGWLTAQEALEWGFVDEVTEMDGESAPRLTNAVASAMASVGMPVPNLPVVEKESVLSVFFDRLNDFFASKTKKITEMKKTFKTICALLAVDALTLNDGNAQLNDAQLSTIEDALSQKDSTIAELEAQIDELKMAPATTTQKVVDEGKQNAPSTGKSGFELYCENYNAARKLYNEV